jgi:hypothetical protein
MNSPVRFWHLLCGICLVLPAEGAVVSECTQFALQRALTNGGTVTFTQACSITLTNTLEITRDVVLDAGGNSVSISGNNAVRILTVASNLSVVIKNLTLTAGVATEGGALRIEPGTSVKLVGCLVSSNRALGPNGAAGIDGNDTYGTGGDGSPGGNGSEAWGGAIYNQGSLTLESCRFLTNAASGGAGGAGGAGGDGRFQGGDGGNGGSGAGSWGGAILNLGQLSITNSTFSGNTSTGGAGGTGGAPGSGPFAGRPGIGGPGLEGAGGAICSFGPISVFASTFTGNRATGGASADGGSYYSGNGTDGLPGGPGTAGAIWCTNALVAVNSTLHNNIATGGAGGDGGPARWTAGKGGDGGSAYGGAILSFANASLTNCTLAENAAVGGTNGIAGSGAVTNDNGRIGSSSGGAIAQNGGTVSLKNSILAYSASGGNAYGTITDLGQNISSDTSFPLGQLSLAGTDPLLGSLADNGGPTSTMLLLQGSPAIQGADPAAAPAFDQRGLPRPAAGKPAPDTGAVEMQPALIVSGPTNVLAANGQSVTYSVVAGGDTPLAYTWRLNGAPLAQATNSFYFLSSVTKEHEGAYTVIVSNAFGSATSQVAQLTVLSDGERQISNIQLVSNEPVLSMLSRTGLTYITEFTASLAVPDWLPVSTNAGNGATLVIPLPGPAAGPAFYRVRLY